MYSVNKWIVDALFPAIFNFEAETLASHFRQETTMYHNLTCNLKWNEITKWIPLPF